MRIIFIGWLFLQGTAFAAWSPRDVRRNLDHALQVVPDARQEAGVILVKRREGSKSYYSACFYRGRRVHRTVRLPENVFYAWYDAFHGLFEHERKTAFRLGCRRRVQVFVEIAGKNTSSADLCADSISPTGQKTFVALYRSLREWKSAKR